MAQRQRPRRRRRRTSTSTAGPVLPDPGPGQRYWVLDVPFAERATAGARWYPQVKASVHVGADLPNHLHPYRSHPHTLHRFTEDELNGHRFTDDDAAAVSMTPRPEQVEGARMIARHAAARHSGGQFLLADDPGTGKTLSAVVGARAVAKLRDARTVLVIADRPAGATIGHWSRSISAISGAAGGPRFVVVTWDRLAKVAGLADWDIVIADESHMVRHQTTQRWKLYARIVGLNRSRNRPYIVTMTATPSQSALEQGYLIPAFADRLGGSTKEWVADWPGHLQRHGIHINPSRYGPVWTDDPAERDADLTRMRGWLTGSNPPAMVHRPAPWGPCPISGLPVTLDPAARRAYEREWAEFCDEMELARRGRNSARGRAAVMRYRQKAGMIRAGVTADWAVAQVEAGRQVAISAEFVETAADPLADMIEGKGVPVARIYGTGRYDAEVERVRFQTGAAPVVVFTATASISLHAGEQLDDTGRRASPAPRVGIFHQPRYSGIQGRQIVGRTHRDYMVSPWKIAYAADTAEEQVAHTMIERYATTAATVGGDTSALTAVRRLLGADWLDDDALTE